jgi:hypothetical protein
VRETQAHWTDTVGAIDLHYEEKLWNDVSLKKSRPSDHFTYGMAKLLWALNGALDFVEMDASAAVKESGVQLNVQYGLGAVGWSDECPLHSDDF